MQAGRPYAQTRLRQFVEQRLAELRPVKTQVEIATAAGVIKPNILTMIKNGATRLPLDRVAGLAAALECDPRHLFMLAFEQFADGSTSQSIREIFGTIVSDNEVAWLEEIRHASDYRDPALTPEARTAIRGVFRK